jgi:D-alanine-D-alanine ligase
VWIRDCKSQMVVGKIESTIVKVRSRPRIVVIYNRDFEGAEADPENKAREDVKDVAEDVLRILNGGAFEASGLGVTSDVCAAMATLTEINPDAVFNLCESIHGDNRFESLMPLLLDLADIPYTGSCSFSLSLALRKEKVKDVLRGHNISVARGGLVNSVAESRALGLSYPMIVKPAREDASVGISSASVVFNENALAARVAYVLENYRQPVLVEEYIEGREIYVSLLERPGQDPQVFPFFEIDFSDMPEDRPKIVSFEGKWVEDSVEYKGTKPVRCVGLAAELRALIAQTALATFRAIGLRDYARVDIRLSGDGIPRVIDVNPNCDLSDLAGGFSRAAKAAGLSYRELVLGIIGLALDRRSSPSASAELAAPGSALGQDEGASQSRQPACPLPGGRAGSV